MHRVGRLILLDERKKEKWRRGEGARGRAFQTRSASAAESPRDDARASSRFLHGHSRAVIVRDIVGCILRFAYLP